MRSIAAKLEQDGVVRRVQLPLARELSAFQRTVTDIITSSSSSSSRHHHELHDATGLASCRHMQWHDDATGGAPSEESASWQLLDSSDAWRRCFVWASTDPASRTLRIRSSSAAQEASAPSPAPCPTPTTRPLTGTAAGVFTLKTLGGACAGPQLIYDGDDPIARLVTDAPMGALEENLMFTINSTAQPKNPRPIMLRDMKLRPGGRPMLSGMQLYWELDGDNHITIVTEVVCSVTFEGQGSNTLKLTVVTEDKYRIVTSTRVVSVCRDAMTGGYCWDVQAGLHFNCPESFLPAGFTAPAVTGCWQYCDPFWMDVPAPSVAFDGCWAKRGYIRYLMEKQDGTVSQAPLNHCWMASANPPTSGFAPDGRLILETSERSNDCACIQFVGSTGPKSVLNLCNWGYDCHLALTSLSRDDIWKQQVSPHFKIGLCPAAVVDAVGKKAAPVAPLKINGLSALPLYSRNCNFDNMLALSAPNPDPDLDAWPWMPMGPGCSLCTTLGRHGGTVSAVKIRKLSADARVASAWEFEHEGPGSWTQRWSADTTIRVSVYCKVTPAEEEANPGNAINSSTSVEHVGAVLGVRWGVTNGDQRHPWRFSQRLNSDSNECGENNWTLLAVSLTKPPEDERASGDLQITLRQDGTGTAEFTEFTLVEQGAA